MSIRVIAVGKLKEKYWREAVSEYLKRLTPYTRVEIIEVAEERIAENPATAEIKRCLAKEGERIQRNLLPGSFKIPLVIEGKLLSSGELAGFLGSLAVAGKSQLTFIIGSSYGLAPEVIAQGDYLLSFSALTFPHQMMRVVLLEQVYRAMKINKGEQYHK